MQFRQQTDHSSSRLYERIDNVEEFFVDHEIIKRSDADERRLKLSQIVSKEIIPRLVQLHQTDVARLTDHPTPENVSDLAHIVLGPDLSAAADFVRSLRDRGLSEDTLFVELLEPTARHLGHMWDQDECDFVDVTLGVGRLQTLLAIFNSTYEIPALSDKRRVLLANTPGEQHSFGLSMVKKFLGAAGWWVDQPSWTEEEISTLVASQWFAVAGLALSTDARVNELSSVIRLIRAEYRNPAIGIMVGGPLFTERPDLVATVGADGSAVNAPAAVVLAQRLFDEGAKRDWKLEFGRSSER
jgi:methanogenic corrinoid protein MtbC1